MWPVLSILGQVNYLVDSTAPPSPKQKNIPEKLLIIRVLP